MASESADNVSMEDKPEVEPRFQELEECDFPAPPGCVTPEPWERQELDPDYVPEQSVPQQATQEQGYNGAYDNVTSGGNYMTGMDYGNGVQYPAQHVQQGYAAPNMPMARQVYPQIGAQMTMGFVQCGPPMVCMPVVPAIMGNLPMQQHQWASAPMQEQFQPQAPTDLFLRPSTLQERLSDQSARFQSGSYTPQDELDLLKRLKNDPPRPASPLSTASLSASEADAGQSASSSASTTASEQDTPRELAEPQGVKKPLSPAAKAFVAQVRQMLKKVAPGDAKMDEELIKLSKQSGDSARAIQHLIEEYQVVETQPRAQLLLAVFERKLSGDPEEFKKMCNDKNSNYVIAKIVEVVSYAGLLWVVQNLILMLECTFNGEAEQPKSHWEGLARHKQGCRILQRVMEHHGDRKEVQKMVTQGVIQHSKNLCRNEYGRYVLEKAWELAETYPTSETLANVRETIAEKTIEDVLKTAKDKQASYMLKFMVSRKKPKVPVEEEYLDKMYHIIVNAVTNSEEVANSLARDKFAHHLIAEILTKPALFPAQHENLVEYLRKDADKLKDHKYPKGNGQGADQEAPEKGPEINKVYAALEKYL